MSLPLLRHALATQSLSGEAGMPVRAVVVERLWWCGCGGAVVVERLWWNGCGGAFCNKVVCGRVVVMRRLWWNGFDIKNNWRRFKKPT